MPSLFQSSPFFILPRMQRLYSPLVYLAVPLAAFLTFMLQPVAGKLLMPVFGGSAGTWITLSMFFQGALLGGYALSWYGLRRWRAELPGIIATLAVVAAVSFHLPLWSFSAKSEWLGVFLALTASLLPVVLFTTTLGLVLQGWLQPRLGSIPFHLYAFSNVGSVLALLAYPFLIEPYFGLSSQITALKILLWTLSALTLALCWLERKSAPVSSPEMETEDESLPHGTGGAWFVLSFATCALMLGAIPILGSEYGSNPLTWVVPLAIYLLSFSVTFSGWWPAAGNYVSMVLLCAGLFGFLQTVGIGPHFLSGWGKVWLLLVLISGCAGGQGFLYRLRPARNASFFYLIIALGGFSAGLFVSALAPLLFDRPVEFTGAAFFLLVFLVLQLLGKAEALPRYSLALLVLIPSLGSVFDQLIQEKNSATVHTAYYRNTYGTLIIRKYPAWLSLSNESTLHGEQLFDPKFRRTPTTYYTRGSAAGIVLNSLREKQKNLRVGAVGLGTGTLAAYGRRGDRFTFWDINPLAIKLAQGKFTYLKESEAKIDIVQADGRVGLAARPDKFDTIIVDAFAGDSVPPHLLTREAVSTYLSHLDHGILVVHISCRNFDLFPVVAGSAHLPGWNCLFIGSNPHDSAKVLTLANDTSYAVVYPGDREDEVMQWFDSFSDPEYSLTIDRAADDDLIYWTDDRSAIMDVLPWRKLIGR